MVDAEGQLEAVLGLGVGHADNAGVVDEYVEAVEFGEHAIGELLDRAEAGQVE